MLDEVEGDNRSNKSSARHSKSMHNDGNIKLSDWI